MLSSNSQQAMHRSDTEENKLANRKPEVTPAAATNFSDLCCLAREESRSCDDAPEKIADEVSTPDLLQVEEHSVDLSAYISDEDDEDANALMIPEDVKDTFGYLKSRETLFLLSENYLSAHTQVKPEMRYALVDWLSQIYYELVLSGRDVCWDTYFLCVNILDRFLASNPTQAKDELPLVGLTALWIANKMKDGIHLEIQDLEELCDNRHVRLQFLDKEREMLAGLGSDHRAPLPSDYLRVLSNVVDLDYVQEAKAEDHILWASVNYQLAATPSSKIAAASLCLALSQTTISDNAWSQTLESLTGYSVSELAPVMSQISAPGIPEISGEDTAGSSQSEWLDITFRALCLQL